MEKTNESKAPEKSFRAGNCSASVFINEVEKDGEKIKIPKVAIDIGYKDKEGNWQSTNRVDTNEIPKVMLVLGKAYEWLVMNKKIKDEPA